MTRVILKRRILKYTRNNSAVNLTTKKVLKAKGPVETIDRRVKNRWDDPIVYQCLRESWMKSYILGIPVRFSLLSEHSPQEILRSRGRFAIISSSSADLSGCRESAMTGDRERDDPPIGLALLTRLASFAKRRTSAEQK